MYRPSCYEVQLETRHLVFALLAAAGLLAGVFFLGVMVGEERGSNGKAANPKASGAGDDAVALLGDPQTPAAAAGRDAPGEDGAASRREPDRATKGDDDVPAEADREENLPGDEADPGDGMGGAQDAGNVGADPGAVPTARDGSPKGRGPLDEAGLASVSRRDRLPGRQTGRQAAAVREREGRRQQTPVTPTRAASTAGTPLPAAVSLTPAPTTRPATAPIIAAASGARSSLPMPPVPALTLTATATPKVTPIPRPTPVARATPVTNAAPTPKTVTPGGDSTRDAATRLPQPTPATERAAAGPVEPQPGAGTAVKTGDESAWGALARQNQHGYSVQVMTIKDDSKSAEREKQSLKARGVPVYVDVKTAGGHRLYKVRVGKFVNKPDASLALEKLRAERKYRSAIVIQDD